VRARWVALTMVVTVFALAACTPSTPTALPHDGTTAPAPVATAQVATTAVVLGSGSQLVAIDPATGSVLFKGTGVHTATDPSRLFTAEPQGASTMLRTRVTATGAVIATATIHGSLAIRVVSADGGRVALMAPLPAGASPWIPAPRPSTDVVVADPTGATPPLRFHIGGNVEPEAFSADGTGLFLIRYLPATAPTAYRVARLDLDDGDVYRVLGRNKTWAQTMSGTRLTQVASQDGAGLYTLYSSQPPSYAAGFDAVQAGAKRPVAFVHSLSLTDGFAVCVGLPKSLWGGAPDAEAIAVSPDGARVYVVDTERGVIAVMDTGRLKVIGSATVDLTSVGSSRTEAAVSPDGSSLFVTRGSRILTIDAETLRPVAARTTGGEVTALGFSLDGRSMYLAMRDEVAVVDVSTGEPTRMIPAPDLGPATFVGSIPA
jgi:hypothetical protein